MGIYKRGGVWWYKFEWNGQRIRKTTNTANRNVALQIEAAARTSLAKREVGVLDNSATPTLTKFGSKFFGYLSAHVAGRTLGFYKDAWKRLVGYKPLAGSKLHLIDVQMIDDFAQQQVKDVMPATVNHSLRTLRRALKLAEEWGLITKCPKVKMVEGERQREFILSDDVLSQFLALASDDMKLLLPFLVDTGCRISEACDLTWDRVSFMPKQGAERGYIYINKGKSKYAKRYIPLTERARRVLLAQKEISRSQFVWVGEDRHRKASRHWAAEQFRNIRIKLGLPWDCVLHSTRHTFCTRLGEAGADAFTIQKLAGHSSIVISQRYVHPTPRSLESAIDRLESISKPKKKAATGVGTAHKIRVQSERKGLVN